MPTYKLLFLDFPLFHFRESPNEAAFHDMVTCTALCDRNELKSFISYATQGWDNLLYVLEQMRIHLSIFGRKQKYTFSYHLFFFRRMNIAFRWKEYTIHSGKVSDL
jgi:hypothetical protein